MESKDIIDINDGIFENKESVVDNLKSAAETVGLAPEVIENIDKEEPKKIYYAKKSCSWCYGRGMLDYARNGIFVSSRRKPMSKVLMRSLKMTNKKLSKSVQKLTALTNGHVRPGRNTCLPEEWKSGEWYVENMTKVLCKCVKVVEED